MRQTFAIRLIPALLAGFVVYLSVGITLFVIAPLFPPVGPLVAYHAFVGLAAGALVAVRVYRTVDLRRSRA